MAKRIKVKNYAGVFYREADRVGGKGKEKIYYIIFKKDGKNLEEKAGRQHANNMTPAKAASIRAQRKEGKRLSRKEIREKAKAKRDAETNKWIINRLWTEYKRRNPALNFATDDSRFEKYISPALGQKEPKDLLPLDVDRLRINLLKIKAPGTVRNVLELLRRIINFGVKKRLCSGADFTIEMPQVNNEKTEDLTPGQLSDLLKAIKNDEHPQAGPMMKMILFTGMRRGELFKLKWKDIDYQRGFINIRDPKGGPDQRIPLNDAARELLKAHPKPSQFVFPGRGGEQRSDIKKPVNKIKKKAGLPKEFRALHGLRHVYASMLASSGKVDMYHLQRLLTHKTPQMTQRYAHLRDSALKKASNLAGDIIKKALEKNTVIQIRGENEK